MIRRSTLPDDDSGGDRELPESVTAQQAEAPPTGVSRKPRGVPVSPTRSAADTTYFNPAQVAEMWGISRDKVITDVLLKKQPNKRFVEVAELAALALFLCTDNGASVTGVALPMDGGWTAH